MNLETVSRPATERADQATLPAQSLALQTVEVVVPVYNEQSSLARCVHRLHRHLSAQPGYEFRITVADNASTDDTLQIAHDLSKALDRVGVIHLDRKGRGAALQAAWGASDADVLVYMDVDLSTDLSALSPLIAPILSGHSDLAIGSRLARGSRVVRGSKREAISRCYNLLLRAALRVGFSDAQCGFKAISRRAARELLPQVQDSNWFFDTELLTIAERAGLRIYEVPVDWVDDPDSRVDIVQTALDDVRGIVRLIREFARGEVPLDEIRLALVRDVTCPAEGERPGLLPQITRFVVIGIASTLSYVLLFLLLSPIVGAQMANFGALLATAVANTAANRRFTFGVRGSNDALKHHGQGIFVFLIALAFTSGSLAIYQHLDLDSRAVELAVLVSANLVATMFRFVALRHWVFPSASASSVTSSGTTSEPVIR